MSGQVVACGSCGAAHDASDNFCRACGAMQAAAPSGYPPVQAQSESHRWAIAGAAGVAILAVAGAILALVLASGGHDGSSRPVTVGTVTSSLAAPVATAPSEQEAPPTTTGATAPPSGATGTAETSYLGARMSARIPARWSIEENEVQKPGYVESKWRVDTRPGAYLLVDESPATHLTPQQDAAPVHDALEKAAGYEEIAYAPGDLGGVSSWMWIFRISGDERVDYFFERCLHTFGVLGSAPVAGFASLRSDFGQIAESVRSPCG
jgi:hypothetical protein